MTLFRCSVLKKEIQISFSDTLHEVYAVGEVLDEIDWRMFKRTGGITSKGVTRFASEEGYDT